MIDFKGKVLVLTGADGGINRSISRLFYDLGASMLLTDIRTEGLKSFAEELDPSGTRIICATYDVGKEEDSTKIFNLAKDHFGLVDFVVPGAGLYCEQPVATMSSSQWRETLSVNLDGVFYFTRAMIPLLKEGGAIVNIASIAAHKGSYMHAHYSATKGAILSFTRSLALELAPNIRVNAVSPGLIDTPMITHLLKIKGERLIDDTPLKRLGRPDEIAKTVAFLCSDWASFITGETIHANGGLYIA
jgi:3-oxoacyl-[acyl-carrier protein] reductase